jgi:hypothetical protein
VTVSQLGAEPTLRRLSYLETLVHVLHDLDGVVAIGQDVQQVSRGYKVETWEGTTLALHVLSQSLLTDLQLLLLFLQVLHEAFLITGCHAVLHLTKLLQQIDTWVRLYY